MPDLIPTPMKIQLTTKIKSAVQKLKNNKVLEKTNSLSSSKKSALDLSYGSIAKIHNNITETGENQNETTHGILRPP